MTAIGKLTGEERRAAIVRAVRRVFAAKGFDGTTTRELADAAGVSEALLFKHFPNKEALFLAMQQSCCDEQDLLKFERISALEPSASTLVLMVHFLVSRIVAGRAPGGDEEAVVNRLMLRSLAEDGEFARVLLHKLTEMGWVRKVEECCKAAAAAGEAHKGPVLAAPGAWFVQHLASTISLYLLPETPVVDHGVPRGKLAEQAVWFALRGIGLKEETIRRHYNPRALALYDD